MVLHSRASLSRNASSMLPKHYCNATETRRSRSWIILIFAAELRSAWRVLLVDSNVFDSAMGAANEVGPRHAMDKRTSNRMIVMAVPVLVGLGLVVSPSFQ